MSESEKVIKKMLGEPFINEFPDYARKIRNGLIILSLISITLNITDIQLSNDSSFLGLRFKNLEIFHVMLCLFIFNAYMFIHFLWCAAHNFVEWRLRLTGTKLAYSTAAGWASPDADHTSDLRQSTLHNWWLNKITLIDKNYELLEAAKSSTSELNKSILIEKEQTGSKDYEDIKRVLLLVNENLNKIQSNLESIEKFNSSKRIDVSLKRFDNWYKIMLKSQNFRWLVIELLFPLVLGVISLTFMLTKGWLLVS